MNSLKMLKRIISVAAVLMTACLLFAVEVDKAELQSVSNTIVFENYTGPHKVVDSLDDIKGIGTGIGAGFKKESSGTYGNTAKYYVIHCVDNTSGALDADIFILGKDAQVDHIRNLRHIIASYLTKAYGYKYDDAYTLATFVTVYNAVYRKNMSYYKSKYKEIVTKNLSSEKAGISISYKEWADASQLVIPLADINGGLSTVDTSVISDKNVVNSMQEEDDKGIDERKNMVDIKEREADAAEEKAKESQKEATKQEEKLKQNKKEYEEAKNDSAQKEKKAEESKKKADEAQKKADANPKDKQAQKDAADAKKQAESDKKEAQNSKKNVEEKKQQVDEQTKKTEDAKNESQKQQAKADKKQTEAQTERKEIAKDQKEVINKKDAEASSVYGLKLVDANSLYSAIVKISKENGKELKTSPVKYIRNRSVYRDGNNFIAIAGEKAGKGAVKLVQIDKDTLEIVAESEETVAEKSVLVPSGSDLLCVVEEKGKYYPAKFNTSLKCTGKSNVEVNPATPIYVSPEGIIVTDKSGKAVITDFSGAKASASKVSDIDER